MKLREYFPWTKQDEGLRTGSNARPSAEFGPPRSRASIGPNSHVDSTAQVLGWDNIRIGRNTIISEHCCINVNLRDALRLTIGDNCFIARRNFFSTGDFIEIGDYCLTGPNCNFLGAGHVTTSPFVPYIASGIESYGRMTIGMNCWLTSGVTILGGVSIGYGTIIGANSLVTIDIPPFALATGAPARIVKLFNRKQQSWQNLTGGPEADEAMLAAHKASLIPEDEFREMLYARHPNVLVPKICAGYSQGEI
jgi:acetyltransferase-like isoleucine patch superfamily enzyme